MSLTMGTKKRVILIRVCLIARERRERKFYAQYKFNTIEEYRTQITEDKAYGLERSNSQRNIKNHEAILIRIGRIQNTAFIKNIKRYDKLQLKKTIAPPGITKINICEMRDLQIFADNQSRKISHSKNTSND